MVIFLIIAIICIIALFVYMYRIAVPKPVDQSGRENLFNFLNLQKGGTQVARAPVVYYQIPGSEQPSKKVKLRYTKTSIGSKNCDIVINHPSVSAKHAEIYLAIKHKRRVFVLKNLSKTNPVVLVKEGNSGEDANYQEITKTVILDPYKKNWFLFGNVKVMIEVPQIIFDEIPVEKMKKQAATGNIEHTEKKDEKKEDEKKEGEKKQDEIKQERPPKPNPGTGPLL